MKQDDPYHQLGLSWGDGASTEQIKQAYRQLAAQIHPDVNQTDPPAVALAKFQRLQRAYHALMKRHGDHSSHTDGGGGGGDEDEWRFSVWRHGDRIACDRTDVAGQARKRPAPPATTTAAWRAYSGALGTGGASARRKSRGGEYLGETPPPVSSSVGRGLNKWVTRTAPQDFQPWTGSSVSAAAMTAQKKSSNQAVVDHPAKMMTTTTMTTLSKEEEENDPSPTQPADPPRTAR